MPVPPSPKIYHIVHVDRLRSIVDAGGLVSDAAVVRDGIAGTTIGMDHIKARRRAKALVSHPGLHVGDCVPFYFCPRSVMLFLIHKANDDDLAYRGGQAPIVHLEADLRETVAWAEGAGLRWAFTLSNAGSFYFEDRSDLAHLDQVDWNAVQARMWAACRERKQAEFLVEERFPWELVRRIGVRTVQVASEVQRLCSGTEPRLRVEHLPGWYY